MATIVDFVFNHLEVTSTLLVGVVVLFIARKLLQQPSNLPPGPLNLPIIGAIPFLQGPPEAFMANVCKKHGPVVRFFVGSLECFGVGNFEAAKDSFIRQGDNFTGKPKFGLSPAMEDSGIGFMEGESWKVHRRFILSTFREFGMGKLSLEPRITEEIHSLMDDIAKLDGQSMDWAKHMSVSVANLICVMEFGARFNYDDPEFLSLRQLLAGTQQIAKTIMLKMCFPWMRYFIPFFDKLIGLDKLVSSLDDLDQFFLKKIDEHRKEYQSGSRRDLIDAFFTERNAVIEKNEPADDYEDHVLRQTLAFLFFAGSDSIIATMKWAFAILLTHPEIMAKIRKEIDDTIGMERMPSTSDRTKMAYTEAFLNEVHRYGSVAPAIMHSNMEATTVMGYHIPKKSTVHCTLMSIHFDPLLWKDPKVICPERFLDENGRLQKPEHLLAFGVGKRNCIGESFARMELFLYLTSLLQRFDIQIPQNETVSIDDAVITLTRSPRPFNLRFIERKNMNISQ